MNSMFKFSSRLIIGILSILFIVYMWMSKDVSFSWGMLVTNFLVSSIKILGLAGIVLILKKV